MSNKRNLVIGLIILVLIAAISFFFLNQNNKPSNLYEKGQKQNLIIGTTGQLKPFSYFDEKNNLTGFDVELVKEALNRLNLKYEFKTAQWDGLLAGLESDRFDIAANHIWYNDSRNQKYNLSKSYYTTDPVIVVKNDNSSINKIEDVKGKKAGHYLEDAYKKLSEQNGAEIVTVENLPQAAQLIKDGRIDYFIETKANYLAYNKEKNDGTLKVVPIPGVPTINVVLGYKKSETSEKLRRLVDEKILELKNDGTYKKLLEKFLGE